MALLVFVAPAAAQTPRVHSLSLASPALIGKPVPLKVTASDPAAPVSGMVVRFDGSDGLFGLTACSARRPPAVARPPFSPGSRVRLSALHVFRSTAPTPVLARVQSGTCATQGGAVLQPAILTPTAPGEAQVPPVLDVPVILPVGGSPSPPPGTGNVPPLPPGADDLPLLPSITGPLPPLPPVPPLPLPAMGIGLAAARACPGARHAPGPSRRARRVARRVVRCLLNTQRIKRGLRPLRASPSLSRAALSQSRAMVRDRFFSHVQPAGIGLVDRVMKTDYLKSNRGAWVVGENLGFGQGRYAVPLIQVRAWMASTPHRANILERSFREIGIGLVDGVPTDGPGATYTTVFGRRHR